jgi:ADP-heptose:LPS heptosyltransferase
MNLPLVRFVDRYIGVPLCRFLAWGLRVWPAAAEPGDPKRILIMRGVGVGNLVLMLPTLKALRERYPAARIDFITLESNRGFLERLGYFSRIWYLSDTSVPGFCGTFALTLPQLLANQYDLFIDFEQFARTSAIVGLLLRIPRRIGFVIRGHGRESAFTDAVSFHRDLHMMDGFYTLLEPLGMPQVTDLVPVPVPTTIKEQLGVDRALAEAAIQPGERIAIVHPGTGENFTLRRWDPQRFAGVADYLAGRGFRIVLTGVRAEADIVARVKQHMREPAFNAVGRFSLGELLALLSRAALVISNDTGPIHLASGQGAPVIGLYGPNTPALYGARGANATAFYLGLPCSPCMTNVNEKASECQNNICMQLMTVDQVIESLSRMFEGVAYMPAVNGGVRPVPGAPPVHPLLVLRKAPVTPVEAARV